MLNKEIPKEKLEKIRLVVFGSDGVTIERGTKIVEKEVDQNYEVSFKTKRISDSLVDLINRLKEKKRVLIASGRSLVYLQSMYSPLFSQRGPEPYQFLENQVYLMAENGTLVFYWEKIHQLFEFEEGYFELLSKIRERIKKLPILGFEPKQFILTVHAPREMKEVYEIVKEIDKVNYLKVLWNGEAFDIMPRKISKGEGLRILCQILGISLEEVMAIGDGINDKEMLEVAGIGVSADKDKLPAEYWTVGEGLPGEILARYLLERI